MIENDPAEPIISGPTQNERNDKASQRQAELEMKRQRSRSSRMNETEEKRQLRLEKARERSRSIRMNENEEHHRNRLEKKREQTRSTRINETKEQRQNRLEKKREQTRLTRINETKEQRQNRLEKNREQTHSARMNETKEQRQNRLEQQRKLSKTNRFKKKLEKQAYGVIESDRNDVETRSLIRPSWPEPIRRELKEARLQQFLKQMSMSALAEVTCVVCNIRTPAKDSKKIAISKIPNINLLKVSQELKDLSKHMNEITRISANTSNI